MMIYHYTNGSKIKAIINDGFIRTTPEKPSFREKAVAWLSKHPHWEPTANKLTIERNGQYRVMTMQETQYASNGLFRLAFKESEIDGLIQWPKLGVVARIPPKIKKTMLTSAALAKADPLHWAGTLTELSISKATIQYLHGDTWVDVSTADIERFKPNNVITGYANTKAKIPFDSWEAITANH